MKILVLGATGAIGASVLRALTDAGHEAIAGSRQRRGPSEGRRIDFADLQSSEQWDRELVGIDVVVNCVGLITEEQAGQFDLVHHRVPQALAASCVRADCALIHVSALGSDSRSEAGYWRSKGLGEEALARQDLNCAILRPSLVFSPQGASSQLMMRLATLPLMFIPGAQVPVRPVHVDDVAALVVRLVKMRGDDQPWPRRIEVAGPRTISLSHYIALLRQGMQAPSGWLGSLPFALTQPLARMTTGLRLPLLAAEPLSMLAASADGRLCPDTPVMNQLLPRPSRDPAHFCTPDMRAGATLGWGYPALTLVIALLWLSTAYVSWFAWPHAVSQIWLAACGIPAALQEPVLLGASMLDAAIGIALLVGLVRSARWLRWLWPLQAALVAAYTLMMSLWLPQFWAHPFGPLSKNLPLLLLFCVMWRLR